MGGGGGEKKKKKRDKKREEKKKKKKRGGNVGKRRIREEMENWRDIKNGFSLLRRGS